MNISNEFTQPEDQNIKDLLITKTGLQSTTTEAVSCAGGEVTVTTDVYSSTADIDNAFANLSIDSSQTTTTAPSSNLNLNYLNDRLNELNRASDLGTNTYSFSLTGTSLTGKPPLVSEFPGQFSTAPNYDINYNTSTSSGYPTFGTDDPIFQPNRRRSVNDDLCNNPIWALLTMPCPTCDGGKKQALKNKAGKKYLDLTKFFQRVMHNPRINLSGIDDMLNGIIQTVDVTQLFHGKKCPTCEGKNTVKDPSGKHNENAKKVADKLNSKKDEIMKKEQKAGGASGCGNRVTVISGHDHIDVGLGMNRTKSYAVSEDGWSPGNVRIGGGVEHVKSNVVFGKNVAATPGGHLSIKCSNKFTCFTGAQGIDLISYGPINIAGGITKITGPEITIGSSTGPVTIEGNHLQLTGKTIGISPKGGDTQVVVQGTLGVDSNLIVNGGAHINGDISCTSMTMPSKLGATKASSQSDMNTGGANWAGLQPDAIMNQIANLKKNVGTMTTAPEMDIVSLKGIQKVADDIKHLCYLGLPFEPLPTGYILPGTPVTLNLLAGTFTGFTGPTNTAGVVTGVGACFGGQITAIVGAPVPLNNFPHHHNLPDMFHTHDHEVPNIKILDTEPMVESCRPKEYSVRMPSGGDDTGINTILANAKRLVAGYLAAAAESVTKYK